MNTSTYTACCDDADEHRKEEEGEEGVEDDDDDDVSLPGFRFHPTDEELLGFYLRRKVDNKPLTIELIKQVDIYKYDPWDLPRPSGDGDKEGYFFCRRGRKYRNSIRPNRVTGSGFWKATGIDKPVYSAGGSKDCIGLKKTLVYYRGSAGKGTKTDWMMHEFRLPTPETAAAATNLIFPHVASSSPSTQEAEVWTICRIFKRSSSNRKYTPDWRELSTSSKRPATNTLTSTTATATTSNNNNIPCSSSSATLMESSNYNYYTSSSSANYYTRGEHLIDFSAGPHHHVDMKPSVSSHVAAAAASFPSSSSMAASSSNTSSPYGSEHNNINNVHHHHRHRDDEDQLLPFGDFDELRSVVEFALDPSNSLL
ncbi:unnamed protein product [Linum tenue]|uniref:NAC domain-containing protein n=1 Tax=Linum tenue TaxID=586396 RepID=A0AAV0MW52_9ROSI|nr:unnamed protein product [Linum tenue]